MCFCAGFAVLSWLQSCKVAVFAAIFALLGTSAVANDWVVNLSDRGFSTSPAGSVVEYQLTVSTTTVNNPVNAVTVEIPEGGLLLGFGEGGDITCDGVTIPKGGLLGEAIFECNVPTLATEADSASTNDQVYQTITNTVSIALENDDQSLLGTDYTNNEDAVSVFIGGPELDLQITKYEDVDPLIRTADVTYTVTVRNNGNSVANGVVLKISCPRVVSSMYPTPVPLMLVV